MVSWNVLRANNSIDGRDVDDIAALLFLHVGNNVFRVQECAGNIYIENVLPFFTGVFVSRLVSSSNSRIVDKYIYLAIFGINGIDYGFYPLIHQLHLMNNTQLFRHLPQYL
jgi:hypothetical protein